MQIAELCARAHALEGVRITDLAAKVGVTLGAGAVHEKGKTSEILERALGATGGSRAVQDFPELGVELKTIPVDRHNVPAESTYVCVVQLLDADREEWPVSWVRKKLSRVLWVPVIDRERIGRAVLWEPTPEQESVLCADYMEIMGRIGAGGIEGLTAHVGRWLQLRPKAASSQVRTLAIGGEEGDVSTVPRGFYLRTKFTGALLADVRAVPE